MPDPTRRPPGHASRGIWILILALLTPAVVVPLAVPLYDRAEPSFAGFPFFYWFQFLLICCAAIETVVRASTAKVRDKEGADATMGRNLGKSKVR